MELTLNAQNHVQVFFRAHEVPEVRGHDLSVVAADVRLGPDGGLCLCSNAWVERLFEVIEVADEVGCLQRRLRAVDGTAGEVQAAFVWLHDNSNLRTL